MNIQGKCLYDDGVMKIFSLEEDKVRLWLYGNFISKKYFLAVGKTKLWILGLLLFTATLSSCSVVRQYQKNFLNDSKLDLSIRGEQPPEFRSRYLH